MQKKLTIPFQEEEINALRAGDVVFVSGDIYTARDAAHKRLCEAMERGESLPFELSGAVIYYAGPCPAKPGQVMNSCGPTTSGRMDKYAPLLYDMGQKAAIGKGKIGEQVIEAMKRNKGVYFIATGGAGALISKCMTAAEAVAYEDLGAEAVRRITVENLPLIVGVDCQGQDVYEIGQRKWSKE